MQPTRTSVGIETPQQTLNRARTMTTGLANSQTPRQVQTTGFKVDIPPVIPSDALRGDTTVSDVLDKRNQMQAQAEQKNQFNTDFTNLMSRVQAPLGATPFQNPQAFIEQTLLNRPTQTDAQLTERSNVQAEGLRNVSTDIQNTRQQTSDALGVVDLQANLAETRKRIADRTVQLRQSLRDFEVNAERRGVAREFVNSERGKVQADAAAELADLAIIESAQAGNLEMAQKDIDRAVEAKIQAFQFENAAIETEIKRLEAVDTKESQARSEQLQIALGERTRLIDQAVSDEKQRLQYLSEAAANGADQGTLLAIQKAATPGEAALIAGPFIGRLDRQLKIAQTGSANRANQDTVLGGGFTTNAAGEKVITTTDGVELPLSEIDFNNPEHIDALPVSSITKAVMSGIGKTKDLTPTQKGQVLSELQQIGFNPNSYVVNKLNTLVEAWSGVPEESKGLVEGLKFWERWTKPDVANFESAKQLLTREIARLNDVGVLSDQDVEAYTNAMPSRQDQSLDVVLQKAGGIASVTAGTKTENVGKRIQLEDGREAVVGADGDTLLDPVTGRPLE